MQRGKCGVEVGGGMDVEGTPSVAVDEKAENRGVEERLVDVGVIVPGLARLLEDVGLARDKVPGFGTGGCQGEMRIAPCRANCLGRRPTLQDSGTGSCVAK